MAWEENSRICLHMQLIAILSRIGVILCKLLNGTDAIPIYKSRRESMEFRRLALYSKNISSDFSKIKLGESITLFLKEAILLVDVSPNIMTTLFLLSSK